MRWARALALAALVAVVLSGGPARAQPAGLPRILGPDDAVRYGLIFELQEEGRWAKADREIKALDNDILLGQVLYQRYMHPTAWRASYPELHMWLKRFADHPGATQIYRLALRRHLKGWKAPTRPRVPRLGTGTRNGPGVAGPRPLSLSRRARAEAARIGRYLARGRPAAAEKRVLATAKAHRLAPFEIDELKRRVAAGWFYKGEDARAWALIRPAAERSHETVPMADWTAGLIAWRLGDRVAAGRHFRRLAAARDVSEDQRAAAAYWAARAALRTGRPDRVVALLEQAAGARRSLYGILAARQLARAPGWDWSEPALDPDRRAELLGVAGVRRAIAFSEAGRADLAGRELRLLGGAAGADAVAGLIALNLRLQTAAAAISLATLEQRRTGTAIEAALYPVPGWRPESGFRVDRAMLYAIARKESAFRTRATSRDGARGLMQLMPRTASFVARDRHLARRDRARLYRPELNLDLGQRYLRHLLAETVVDGNLLYLIAAYNAGPGNLAKWLKRMNHADDPLLFMAALPSRETRDFLIQVLTNLWIYRARLGQDAPSLRAIAESRWPAYIAQDEPTVLVPKPREP